MGKRHEIWSIPNILSCIRILLIPVFVILFLEGVKTDSRSYFLWSAIVVAVSGVTDVADGFIARKFNMITELGKALDPIADKLTQAAIVFCLILSYPMVWVVVVIFVIKELFMAISGLIFLKMGKKLNGAMWFGKLSTVVFYVVMFGLIAAPKLEDYVGTQTAEFIVFVGLVLTGFFLIMSFALYACEYMKMYNEIKSGRENEVKTDDKI